MKLSLLILGMVLVVGCDEEPGPPKPPVPSASLKLVGDTSFSTKSCMDVLTFRDSEKGVTCYALTGCDGRGAISCLKVE